MECLRPSSEVDLDRPAMANWPGSVGDPRAERGEFWSGKVMKTNLGACIRCLICTTSARVLVGKFKAGLDGLTWSRRCSRYTTVIHDPASLRLLLAHNFDRLFGTLDHQLWCTSKSVSIEQLTITLPMTLIMRVSRNLVISQSSSGVAPSRFIPAF